MNKIFRIETSHTWILKFLIIASIKITIWLWLWAWAYFVSNYDLSYEHIRTIDTPPILYVIIFDIPSVVEQKNVKRHNVAKMSKNEVVFFFFRW